MHQSASYLATDEEERPCDDLPVFDKSAFHLVGERRTGGEKSARGKRGGEERASEGRFEANAVKENCRSWETDREKEIFFFFFLKTARLREKRPYTHLTQRDCVFSEPYGVSIIPFDVAIMTGN